MAFRLLGGFPLRRTVVAALVLATAPALPALRALAAEPVLMSVDPHRQNVVRFAPVEARFVRFVIEAVTASQPCLDELEVFAAGKEENLALASAGAKATASDLLEGHPSHRIEHLNDGLFGNARSWIAGRATGWAQIELPEPAVLDRVGFSRSRGGGHTDRMPTQFRVEVSSDGETWTTVAHRRAFQVAAEEQLMLAHRPVVLEVPPLEARFVRVAIRESNQGEPGIDELEVYAAADPEKNLALASAGGKASASSCIEGYAIHRVEHLNDGRYGNDHSWIAAEPTGWAQVELPATVALDRVVISRDRSGRYPTRMVTDLAVEISPDGLDWTTVKLARARTNLPLDQMVEGEKPRDWAHRITAQLPEWLKPAARARLEGIETEADARALLDLHAVERSRAVMLARLQLEMKPEAIRRAVADLRRQFGAAYRLPDDFEARLDACEPLVEEVRRQLTSAAGLAQVEQAIARGEELFALQREALLANPLLDFEELLVLQRKWPEGRRGDTYWDWGQQYGLTVNWSCDFRPKNPPVAPWWDEALAAVKVHRRDERPRVVFKAEPTHMLQQPDLDFDARKILFAMPGPKGAFQVFEIGVDGAGLRQITRDTAPDVDNGDPCYLPDGRILFNSTRLFAGVPCEDGNSYTSGLCLTDADGNTTRMLTFDQESNWHPSLLHNGRVLFTRYEYANVSHQFGRLLFHMNPDGTNQMEYYGSNSYWPNSIFYGRAIPGHPTMVAGVVCGHHGPNKTGPIVLFDPARGRRETAGAVQLIPGHGKKVERIVEDYLYGDFWPKFVHPWPLSEKYFLAAARLHPAQQEYAIYLVDVFDNVTEICRLPGYSLMEPIPLAPRPRPPAIPDRVDPTSRRATVYMANVYHGRALEDVPRGSVKRLRLFTYNYTYRHSGHSGFGHLATPGVDGPWEPRHILGTVPVAEDGSALFDVPANTPISVQPLDAQGRALQVMRSWFTAMPGEVLSCVGCHEPQNTAPPAAYSQAALARPAQIEPWRGPPRGFDFELEVQPVLDRYCVGCHDGSQPDRPDFARKSDEQKRRINAAYHTATGTNITTVFTPAFIALHPYVRRPHAEDNYGLQVAAEFFADTSPLVQLLKKGHHNVELDAEAWDRLYTWIDLSAPDMGSWKYSEWGVSADYYERRLEMLRRYAGRTDDVEWLPEPGPVPAFVPPPDAPPAEVPTCEDWPFDAAAARQRQEAAGGPVEMILPLGEGVEPLELVRIPAGEFVMGDAGGPAAERPLCRVRIERPFYLSRREVTNAQFRAIVDSQHSSGIVGWRSIDWRGEGYSLEDPQGPAVRVSWHQAVTFAQAVARTTGKPVRLPAEAEWEWAARAGSAEPLWYGSLDADFSQFENLAGAEMRGFAFGGKRNWYLQDRRFDDGRMLAAPPGSLRPNPWGLYDMAGNVREWTGTAYRPYPYDRADGREAPQPEGEKVVRGGSWDNRPVEARSGWRWKYPAWRRVYNVGFRVAVDAEAHVVAAAP